jgi:hypothetical protein
MQAHAMAFQHSSLFHSFKESPPSFRGSSSQYRRHSMKSSIFFNEFDDGFFVWFSKREVYRFQREQMFHF